MRLPLLLIVDPTVTAWSPAALPLLRSRSPRRVAVVCEAPGARMMPSGLVFEEITAGTGDSPALEQTVKVHYTGSLSDGTVFDSSFSRGEPTEFKLNSVIQGWQEGLQLMRVGGKARLTIPASLGYGAKQMNSIPPNSELNFEVELLGAKSESMLPDNYLGRSFGGASINKDEDSTRDPKVALASNVVIAIVVSALAFGGLFP